MVSIIGLDSGKVQQLCDAANEEVDEANKVQIANFLCTVSLFILDPTTEYNIFLHNILARYFSYLVKATASCSCRETMLSLGALKELKQLKQRQNHLRLE